MQFSQESESRHLKSCSTPTLTTSDSIQNVSKSLITRIGIAYTRFLIPLNNKFEYQVV